VSERRKNARTLEREGERERKRERKREREREREKSTEASEGQTERDVCMAGEGPDLCPKTWMRLNLPK